MPAEAIRLGPFTGGLNTSSDEAAVQDVDLVICENLELDLDGSLTTRPPVIRVLNTFPAPYTNIHLLGYYISNTGAKYLIASNGASRTLYYNGTSWILITDSLGAVDIVQYRDKLWLLAQPSIGAATPQTGGSWDPASGFATVSSMPRGRTIQVNKERLWIGAGENSGESSRLYYSAVGQPTVWDTPNGGGFVNISAGDGQNIVEVVVYYSDILIFKDHSVYRLAYSSSPESGQVTRLSSTVGVAAKNCVVVYENTTYVLYADKVYELVNYNFSLISAKVPLKAENPAAVQRPFGLGAWSDRLMVTYYDVTYVYGLRTGTWSTWKSAFGALARAVPSPASQNSPTEVFFTNNRNGIPALYRMRNELTTVGEPFVAKMRTKHYDYQASHSFKRLMWWGADLIAKRKVTGIAVPIVYSIGVTHAQMSAYTHAYLSGFPHGRMLAGSLQVVDPVDISSNAAGTERKFIRFVKSLRFRHIYFEMWFETMGTIDTAPAKLFTILTPVRSGQVVPKKIN